MSKPKAPEVGVYVPSLSFWTNAWNADPDLVNFRKHMNRMVEGQLKGVLLFSYFGEGKMIKKEERGQFLDVAMELLKPHGIKVLVECGMESLWETVERITEAYDAGADYAFVSVPTAYETEVMTEDVFEFFHQLGEFAKIPFIIRQPKAGTIDFSADFVRRLRRIKNCVGILFNMQDPSVSIIAKENKDKDDFAVFCTYPGDLGAIEDNIRLSSSLANILGGGMAQMYFHHRHNEAMEQILETKVLREIGTKVVALKYAMTRVCAYGGTCRPPLPVPYRELQARVDPILPSLVMDNIRRRFQDAEDE